jgi:hypothetical protein
MSARKALRDALSAALEGWQLVSDPRSLDSVRKPGAVVLGTNKRTRVPALGLGWFTEELTLWVLTATTKPELIEDDLDGLLLQVLEVLEPLEWASWDTADRMVLADAYDGYKLTVTTNVQLTDDTNPEEP